MKVRKRHALLIVLALCVCTVPMWPYLKGPVISVV